MKNKIKLTDLSHIETSKEEMSHLKGGDNPEEGPLCWGCKCACGSSEIERDNNKNSARNNGTESWGVDQGVYIVGGIVLLLL